MKSKFGEQFNHNSQARGYDEEIKNEENPVREGYQNVLFWIKEVTPKSGSIIELGCGTGNTTKMFSDNLSTIFCIDISSDMLQVAKKKMKSNENIKFVNDDLLSFISDYNEEKVDAIVSMYALHHLSQEEKRTLFKTASKILKDKGNLIFADLMFEDRKYEDDMRLKYPNLEEDFNDEFWWIIDEEKKYLEEMGFNVIVKRFSDLSWGFIAEKT